MRRCRLGQAVTGAWAISASLGPCRLIGGLVNCLLAFRWPEALEQQTKDGQNR